MSSKTPKIQSLIAGLSAPGYDPRYLGFFRCFNKQLYFEAHEVLEDLWLEQRQGADYHFYKGLIQLAGAFVHLQKNRPQPALALFGLAEKNLGRYPVKHHALDSSRVQTVIETWRVRALSLDNADLLSRHTPPFLHPDITTDVVESPAQA